MQYQISLSCNTLLNGVVQVLLSLVISNNAIMQYRQLSLLINIENRYLETLILTFKVNLCGSPYQISLSCDDIKISIYQYANMLHLNQNIYNPESYIIFNIKKPNFNVSSLHFNFNSSALHFKFNSSSNFPFIFPKMFKI